MTIFAKSPYITRVPPHAGGSSGAARRTEAAAAQAPADNATGQLVLYNGGAGGGGLGTPATHGSTTQASLPPTGGPFLHSQVLTDGSDLICLFWSSLRM